MQIIRQKNLYILFFAIMLCIYPLYTTAETRTFTHKEEIVDSYGPDAKLHVWKARVYDDGTTVIRIIRSKSETDTSTCLFEMLSLRIIHSNGTVVEKDIKLDIQPFNFCIFANPNPSVLVGPYIEFLDYQLIRKNHILVTYYNATNPNDINDIHTSHWGMVIDFDGNVFSRIPFGPAFFDQQSQSIIPNAFIQLNVNREKGFFRFVPISNSRDAEWRQYKVENDGTITKLTAGTIPFDLANSTVTALSTTDESYAIVFTYTSQGQLFVVNIGYNQTATSPFLLYKAPISDVIFPLLFCYVASARVGQVCVLAVIKSGHILSDRTTYIKINFSSGSVLLTVVTNLSLLNITNDDNDNLVAVGLPFGGHLITKITSDSYNIFIFGYLFDENSGNYTRWELQEPEQTSLSGAYIILPHNNTLLLSQPNNDNYSWRFKVIDLPRFAAVNTDKGYSNVNIAGTSPEIQSSVSSDISKISIDFYNQVDLSVGKLSIYQLVDEQPYLRQSIPADSCLLENDGKTVSAIVLESTFSISNGNYFIQMDNNFVKDRVFKEPLLGIKENVWKFTTQQKIHEFAPSTTGLLRLTVNGAQAFDNLSQEQRIDFFDTLLKELSYAVPIPLSRLSTSGKAQLDNSRRCKQYLISVGIEDSKNQNDINVVSIVKVIDIMVKNRNQTPIGLIGKITASYLDSSYGFQHSYESNTENEIETIRTKKCGLAGLWTAILLFVGALYLFAQGRDNNGNKIAILQLGVIIFDWVMNILFVSNSARNVPALYISSIVFVTIPIALNMLLAFNIIAQENIRLDFSQWFMAHRGVLLTFILLSGADIGVLHILHLNFQLFGAPFSDTAKSMILWSSACVNMFIGNVPQIAIQIFYNSFTASYDIIPLLTLISSVLHLVINVLSGLYQATNYLNDSGEKDLLTLKED